MILSTQTDSTAREFGLITAIRMIADAGFDAIDLSMFDEDCNAWMFEDGFLPLIEEAAETAGQCGVYFNQAHAPFPTMKDNDSDFNAKRLFQVRRSIEIAGILGVKNIVVHPVNFSFDKKNRNIEMYNALLPFAKNSGVKIALENMWGRDDRRGVITKNVCSDAAGLLDYVNELDPEWFTVCLDIGHIGLVGDYEKDTILALGAEKLTCVHVHDNDYLHDLHIAPFTGKLPWNDICDAFAQICYKGDLTLEADQFLSKIPRSLYPSALRFMHDAGRELIRMIVK